jgi:hypothetical protein
VRYEDVALDTMEAVSASLVRAQCVRLAVALKDSVADDGSLQASADPLPEVLPAYKAAHTLLTFWQRNRIKFDTLALQSKRTYVSGN